MSAVLFYRQFKVLEINNLHFSLFKKKKKNSTCKAPAFQSTRMNNAPDLNFLLPLTSPHSSHMTQDGKPEGLSGMLNVAGREDSEVCLSRINNISPSLKKKRNRLTTPAGYL